ncbi:MAG: hypothetical protein HYT94_03810 [Parcubacteria group bacterium]|nr:hypothetical protein [Parcubacteria group bacterium]
MDTFKGNFEFQELTTEEPPKHVSLFVAEWLLEHGYALNFRGTQRTPEEDGTIYIHGEQPPIRKLFGLIPYQPLRPYLGHLYFDRPSRWGTWLFSGNKDLCNNVLYGLEQKFRVRIHAPEGIDQAY